VCVQAGSLAPLEAPEAYADVLRRVLGRDGVIRNLTPQDGAAAAGG
jgi:hypothetical protein